LLTVERILDFGYSRISDLTRSVLEIALELVAVSLSTETVLIKADLHTYSAHEKDNTYMRMSANTNAFECSFLVQAVGDRNQREEDIIKAGLRLHSRRGSDTATSPAV